MAFPTTVNVNGSVWTRESCRDGWVYRVTGVQNPHVTIHDESTDFYGWLRRGGYHLRYSGASGLWEYNKGEPDPFGTPGGSLTTNKGAEEPQANALAKEFWKAIKALG
jgi:hypothetical protein